MPASLVTSVNSIGPEGRGGVGLGEGDASRYLLSRRIRRRRYLRRLFASRNHKRQTKQEIIPKSQFVGVASATHIRKGVPRSYLYKHFANIFCNYACSY